jgi:glycolate oxidase iron-sulfur subunit
VSTAENLPGRSAEGAKTGPDPALIEKCVHCGFCLPSCPTYMLWGEEMDSPRGRIYLMRAAVDGRAPMSGSFVKHFDACLGCMACVTSCPSGVQYAPLIEATRAQIEQTHQRSFGDRLFRSAIFSVLPYPGRLRLALVPLALLPSNGGRRANPSNSPNLPNLHNLPNPQNPPGLMSRLRSMLDLAPRVSWSTLFAPALPERTPAAGERRMTVGLLEGCAQRVMFPQVNRATVNVLAAEGCDVVSPAGQGCCGALALHAGRLDDAREAARRTIEAFDRAGVERIVVNAAGCGSSMKEYGHLLADDPTWAPRAAAFSARVRDVSEMVVELVPARAERKPMKLRVAYQDACHLAHAQGVRQPPRQLLASIPGVEVVPVADGDVCCGSAGIYNLVEPDAARQLGDRKAATLAAARPDVVASANPGCTVQITAAAARSGVPMRVLHPIEILDAAIAGRSIATEAQSH